MARPLRIEFKNAYYHVFSRGERKDDIFKGAEGYSKFLEKFRILGSRNIDKTSFLS